MDISKIEAGRFSVDLKIVNIDQLMSELFDTYKKLVDFKSVRLIYYSENSNEPILVNTDGGRLRQIICNLLNNAIKFTRQGEIQFGYRLQGNDLEFYVTDSGIGIASENLALIFQRFRQVETPKEQLNEGNGLGLTISKALVEKLGGKLSVSSEPGKGSSFVFTIPYFKTI
jgi:signal transduction histidine kinase